MATQQQARITARLKNPANGKIVRDLGVWDTFSPAETTAEIPTNRPGGSLKLKSYAALPDHGDITISRVRENVRDWELVRYLNTVVGKVLLEVSEQPLDDDFVPWGSPTTTVGRLSGVTPSEVDSNGNELRTIEISATTESVV